MELNQNALPIHPCSGARLTNTFGSMIPCQARVAGQVKMNSLGRLLYLRLRSELIYQVPEGQVDHVHVNS